MNYNTFKNKYFNENSDCSAYFCSEFDKFDFLNERKNEEDKLYFNEDFRKKY